MLQFLADYWFVWVSIAVISGAISADLYMRRKNQVQAQFVGIGCAAIIALAFQIATIVMAICSVLGLVLKWFMWKHGG